MSKITITLHDQVGDFAENKEVAKQLRIQTIMPALLEKKTIVLDFQGVNGATQSFIHALLSEPIREFRDVAYENLYYDNANDTVQEIVAIVYRYMQESLES